MKPSTSLPPNSPCNLQPRLFRSILHARRTVDANLTAQPFAACLNPSTQPTWQPADCTCSGEPSPQDADLPNGGDPMPWERARSSSGMDHVFGVGFALCVPYGVGAQ